MRQLSIITIIYVGLLGLAIAYSVLKPSPKSELAPASSVVAPAVLSPSSEIVPEPTALPPQEKADSVSVSSEDAVNQAQVATEVSEVSDSVEETQKIIEAAKPATSQAINSQELVIADFDTGDKPNNLGGDFGSWNKDPEDETQSCTMSFETDDALKDPAGYALKLDYDVDSPHPAYNGVWMKLDGQNAASFNTLSFYVRGEGLNNFTKRIKLELKDSSKNSSPYIVSGISDAWQKIEVPFDRFKKIKDRSSLSELVVVFDDMNSNPKQGTILIDQIVFEKK